LPCGGVIKAAFYKECDTVIALCYQQKSVFSHLPLFSHLLRLSGKPIFLQMVNKMVNKMIDFLAVF